MGVASTARSDNHSCCATDVHCLELCFPVIAVVAESEDQVAFLRFFQRFEERLQCIKHTWMVGIRRRELGSSPASEHTALA